MHYKNSQSGAHDFDFLLRPWTIHNRRRTNTLDREKEGVWEEFEAHHMGEHDLDKKIIIEHFNATFPNGEKRLGLAIRTFDEETQQWSIRWLDNCNAPDFRPLVGKFTDGVGIFFQVIETVDGQPLHVRFIWDNITENTARWQQAFSFDEGKTWDTNWTMQFTREQ